MITSLADEEVLDLVDVRDTVIGTIPRADYYRIERQNLGYIRAVEFFIVNQEGELWIPKRTAHKKIAPNGLDFSAGGHVSTGETYVESGLREVEEELNLKLTEADLEFAGKFGPVTGIPYFHEVYLFRSNGAPEYNPDDFVSAEWLKPRQLLDKLDGGVPAKMLLGPTVRQLLADGKL